MTIMVTGASGHVGGNLVRRLLELGRPVRVLVHRSSAALEGLDVERRAGSVGDPESLERAFEGADVVFHLAGKISLIERERALVNDVNVVGVGNVVNACLAAGVRRLVHVSSIHAIAQTPLGTPMDEACPLVESQAPCYDISKAGGQRAVQDGVRRGLDAVIVNPTGIIGPLDFEWSRMGHVLHQLYHGTLPALVRGGFDWVDVRDVVEGALAAMERGRTGENYILSGAYASVTDVAALWGKVTGRRMPSWASPMWAARLGLPFIALWSRLTGRPPLYTPASLEALRSNPDVRHDKAARELGYRPRPLEETLRDVLAWMTASGRVP